MNRTPSVNPPFGLKANEVKQLASFTFDDNAYSGLPGSGGEGGIKFILDLFNENKNHDGSPIVGTFFLKADNITDNDTEENRYVKEIWHRAQVEGNEIAMHTYSHPHGLEFDWDADPVTRTPIMDLNDWLAEHEKWYKTMEKPYAPEKEDSGLGIKKEDVVGFRTPFLEYNDNLFTSLDKLGILYEAAVEEGWQEDKNGTNEFWPYTMDNGSPGETFVSEVFYNQKPMISSHPGLWALPMYVFTTPPDELCEKYGTKPGLRARLAADNPDFDVNTGKLTGMDWNLWFEYFMDEDDAFATMAYTFDLHYEGNRCPFYVGMHTDIYCDKYDKNDLEGEEITRIKANAEQRRNMVRRMLAHILSKKDVQVLTAKDTIKYLNDPELLKI